MVDTTVSATATVLSRARSVERSVQAFQCVRPQSQARAELRIWSDKCVQAAKRFAHIGPIVVETCLTRASPMQTITVRTCRLWSSRFLTRLTPRARSAT